MVHQFKTAVFDLDGTLLNTAEGIRSSVLYTIQKFDLPPLEDAELDRFIGPPIQNSFARAYGLEGAVLQELATVFRNHYKDVDLLKAVPYEGIYQVFEQLLAQKIQPAIATYKRQDYAIQILTHFGFDRYTSIMCGADHENKLKKSDIIQNAIRLAGNPVPLETVMIGDSDNDAIGAEQAGIPFVGVTYGFGFHSEADVRKYPCVGVASDTEELCRLLTGV